MALGSHYPIPIQVYFLFFSTQIRNNKTINVFEDGKESRDFIFIDDAVNATILAIENEKANNEVFNVGTEIPTEVMTVAEMLTEKNGKRKKDTHLAQLPVRRY